MEARPRRTVSISVSVTPALKAELETEAWEENRSLSQYIAGLLARRGKWARTVGTAGGYEVAPEEPVADK
jgi:hypothetical protein